MDIIFSSLISSTVNILQARKKKKENILMKSADILCETKNSAGGEELFTFTKIKTKI